MNIIAALFLGTVFGELLFRFPVAQVVSPLLNLIGSVLFLGLLKVAVLPLIACSIFCSLAGMNQGESLKKIGWLSAAFYIGTMLLAVVMGLILVVAIEPGAYLRGMTLDESTAVTVAAADKGLAGLVENLVSLAVPTNFFNALSEGNTLSVIVVTILFSLGYRASIGNQGRLVVISEEVVAVLMYLLNKLLYFTPLAVFCLLAETVSSTGFASFGEAIGWYFLVVILGLALHLLITLNLLYRLFCRDSLFRLFRQVKEAVFTAFSTASSSATLPVTLKVVVEKAKVPKSIANLVLPLGSTVNMDGTALYEAVAVVFLAQVFGIDLTLSQLFLVAITASFAAIGAAGIPSAGLVTMVIVVDTVNKTLTGVQIPIEAVGIILGVDRVLDMARTSVNVVGDIVGCKIVSELSVKD